MVIANFTSSGEKLLVINRKILAVRSNQSKGKWVGPKDRGGALTAFDAYPYDF